MAKKTKVIVVYPYIMHYRKPVFEEMLNNRNNIEYMFFADEYCNIESLPVLKRSIESCGKDLYGAWIKIRSIWFGKHFLWQVGVLERAAFADYDVLLLLGNMYYFSNWFGLFFAKLRRKKVLMWTHGLRDRETGLKGLCRRFFYKCSDGLLLYGQRAKRLLSDCGLKENKMYVIYNSLDLERQEKIINEIKESDVEKRKKELGISDSEITILCIGRLTPDKNIPFLVDALTILDKRKVKYKAIIVGDGPDKEELMEKVRSLRLAEKVILYGGCYCETDIAILHSISDVSVIPGDIGLSVIHSFTYGVPVITHDNFARHKPEFEAITPGVTGDFYKFGCAESLADQILKWAAKTKEDKNNIVKNCQEVVFNIYNARNQELLISEAILSTIEAR